MIFDFATLFPSDHKFRNGDIAADEFERTIRDTVIQEYPLDLIDTLTYTEGGVTVVLDSGEIIEVHVDWHEFVLS